MTEHQKELAGNFLAILTLGLSRVFLNVRGRINWEKTVEARLAVLERNYKLCEYNNKRGQIDEKTRYE